MLCKTDIKESLIAEVQDRLNQGISPEQINNDFKEEIIKPIDDILKNKYSQELIPYVWKRLSKEGIDNVDNLIGTRETIENIDFNKFWKNVNNIDIQTLIKAYEKNKQKQLDEFKEFGEKGFNPQTGNIVNDDISWWNNKINEVKNLLQKYIIEPSESLIDKYWEVNKPQKNLLKDSSSQLNNIKPGLEELFESNQDLANSVYEALGFKGERTIETAKGSTYRYLPSGKTQRFKKVEGKEYEPQDILTFVPNYEWIKSNNPQWLEKQGLENDTQYTQYLLEKVQGKGKVWIVDSKGKKIETNQDAKTADRLFIAFGKKDGTVEDFIPVSKEPVIGFYTYDSRIHFDEKGERYRDRHLGNKVVKITEGITPQQKQQAQQLYSQYLEQNPNGTIEQFKSWVDQFNKNKYLQLASDLTNPAIEELDNFLLDFLKQFNVKTKEFEELKSKLGVDALGATDVLNKLIWYVKNRNEETLPEEAAHMLVALMGENHPDIKELLNNITNWSEYNNIKKEYLPIYKDENKVKIEALGKLIAKSLVKNYKVNGLDKNLLQKALDKILNFIEDILNSMNLSNVFFYNQSIADHIAINVLSGNKDYIYKIKNLNPNLNALEEIENNPNAKKIINTFSSSNVKMTGSLAIAGTENIRRPKGQGIHDIDFKVKSFQVFEKEILPKIPDNAVPAHYGWHKKTYSTFAYLIPREGYYIKVLERKDDFSNGWITSYELYDENNNKIDITQDNVTAVDFFVYKEEANQKDFDFSSEFIPATLVYEGKISLGGKSNPYFFSRDKDQEDYVLRNPKSFIPFKEHIYYQLKNNLSDFISQKSQEKLNQIKDVFNQNLELSKIGTVEQYASYLDTIFPDSKVKEMDSSLYISVLNQLEQENKIEKDCSGSKLKAKDGIATLFEQGGKWEIVTDFKNAPTHKSGGKNISIQDKKVEVEKNELKIENDFGDVAVIPSKYRIEVQDAIKSNCHSCIDGIVESLPKMKDYAGDGTVFPFFGRYKRFKNSLPDNLKNTPEDEYAMRYYWKHSNKPKSFDEVINREQPMFTMEDDGYYHAPSVEPNTLRFLKPKTHPTLQYELDWYNSDNPEAVDFRNKYDLDTSDKFYKYVPKKK